MDATPFRIGLIRVITLDDPAAVNLHANLIMQAYPGLEIESRCIPDQPEGIHSHELEALAVPKIVQMAQQAFARKDMILVSCADDPAVAEIRAALPGVPVTGAGESTVAMALRYGAHVGVLGITDYAPKAYLRLLGDRLVGNFRPEGVHSTLDLQTPEGWNSCIAKACELKEAGADVIAFGCTGLATIGIARSIEEATGLPCVDPVLAMGAMASFERAKRLLGR